MVSIPSIPFFVCGDQATVAYLRGPKFICSQQKIPQIKLHGTIHREHSSKKCLFPSCKLWEYSLRLFPTNIILVVIWVDTLCIQDGRTHLFLGSLYSVDAGSNNSHVNQWTRLKKIFYSTIISCDQTSSTVMLMLFFQAKELSLYWMLFQAV